MVYVKHGSHWKFLEKLFSNMLAFFISFIISRVSYLPSLTWNRLMICSPSSCKIFCCLCNASLAFEKQQIKCVLCLECNRLNCSSIYWIHIPVKLSATLPISSLSHLLIVDTIDKYFVFLFCISLFIP